MTPKRSVSTQLRLAFSLPSCQPIAPGSLDSKASSLLPKLHFGDHRSIDESCASAAPSVAKGISIFTSSNRLRCFSGRRLGMDA